MASITINKLTGKNVTFAFAMVSSYTLAVVRVGDLPVIIPPWTLKPVELPPYDPARPYFFLVQKTGEPVWRSLYFVTRADIPFPSGYAWRPADMHYPPPPLNVSTTTCSGKTGTSSSTPDSPCTSTAAALCPKDHFYRLFQMRTLIWLDDTDTEYKIPMEAITSGILRCGGGCGNTDRLPLYSYIVANTLPKHDGWFSPTDDDWLVKVATDESVPAVFAVLPEIVVIARDPQYQYDKAWPAGKYVENYYITSTIDRCALNYYAAEGSNPILVPQLCATQMEKGTDTNGKSLMPLQAIYDAGQYLCDAHVGDPKCAVDPSEAFTPC
jgi:hypothetical protein